VVSQTRCRIEVFPAFARPIMSTRNLILRGTRVSFLDELDVTCPIV
jgi:hypothetical protein